MPSGNSSSCSRRGCSTAGFHALAGERYALVGARQPDAGYSVPTRSGHSMPDAGSPPLGSVSFQ